LFDNLIDQVFKYTGIFIVAIGAFIVWLANVTDALKKIRGVLKGAFPSKKRKIRNFISMQLETSPPFYGNSIEGNVRPQMEVYIQSFSFPEHSIPGEKAKLLLKMIEERKNPEKPTAYFSGDLEFRAEMDRFINSAREYIA